MSWFQRNYEITAEASAAWYEAKGLAQEQPDEEEEADDDDLG